MFSFLCLHFIRPEPCNPTTVSLFGHAFLGLDSISYLGSSASCRGESCLLTVQVYGRLDISSVSSSLRISFLSCTILSLRELLHLIRRSTNWTCLILVERRTFLISCDAHSRVRTLNSFWQKEPKIRWASALKSCSGPYRWQKFKVGDENVLGSGGAMAIC